MLIGGWLDISMKLPKDVEYIIDQIELNGYEAYVVGGCVRDALLGKEPHDYDICTSATPDEMLKIFKDDRIVPTGLKHGTVTIIINGTGYECTTYRIDGDYSDGRRPDNVQFTKDLYEDLKRRDFTINAIAYNPVSGLIDPFNGCSDIKDKIIRCVGSPTDRFNEDALRIMRAIRFSAQLGFDVEEETRKEILNYKQYKKLKKVSVERIREEFCKILMSRNCFKILKDFDKILNCFIYNYNSEALEVMTILEILGELTHHDLITRLVIFFSNNDHSYTDMRYLKFDNKTIHDVVELVKLLKTDSNTHNKPEVKMLLGKIGVTQFCRLVEIKQILNQVNYLNNKDKLNNSRILLKEILNNNECYLPKQLAVNGNDLLEIGYKQGEELGKALKLLLEKVIEETIENDKEILLKEARKMLRKGNKND